MASAKIQKLHGYPTQIHSRWQDGNAKQTYYAKIF
jgi:hypothetical protein